MFLLFLTLTSNADAEIVINELMQSNVYCLMDDILFALCFQDNIECTQLVLRTILDMPELIVKSAKTQVILSNENGRSVRLDAFATDGKKFYNIEVQRRSSGAIAQRARFYSSLIDANIFDKKKDFKESPETFVIFITERDVLGGGKQIYHIERMIREIDKQFNDGAHIVYVNGAKREGSEPLDLLLQDFFNKNARAMNNDVLADRISTVRGKERVKKPMAVITLDDIYEEGHARGKLEGKLEGKIEGKVEGKIEGKIETSLANLRRLITKLNMTVDEAMELLEIPQDERAHYATLLKN